MQVLATAILIPLLIASHQTEHVQRIVTASNVRMRSAPETNAGILASLSIGTLLTELEVSAGSEWFRVQTPDGKSGWVFGNLTEPFNERERTDIYRRIIQSRLKT